MNLTEAVTVHPALSPNDVLQEGLAATAVVLTPTVVADGFVQFGRRYRDDWPGFIRGCVQWKDRQDLTPYQYEIAAELQAGRRAAIRGPHGLGKTALAALITLAFVLTREACGDDWKVPTTAGAWRQLTKYLWPEIHKWARKLDWQKIGRMPFTHLELLRLSLKLDHGEAFAVASNNHELIEGATDDGDAVIQAFYTVALGWENLDLNQDQPLGFEEQVTSPLMQQIVNRMPHLFDRGEDLGRCGACRHRDAAGNVCNMIKMQVDATERAYELLEERGGET